MNPKPAWYLTLILVSWMCGVHAHEARPFYIEISERSDGQYLVGWQIPPSLPAVNRPGVLLPEDCLQAGFIEDPGTFTGQRLYRCAVALDGRVVSIRYPQYNPSVSTLLRITFATGEQHTLLAGPEEIAAVIPMRETSAGVADQYLRLGVGHILSGFDHLLFLTCLLFIARTTRRMVVVVSGFTLAHSVTLALAALNLVQVAGPPMEAAIALSIVFLATEIARGEIKGIGRSTITWRFPIAVSCSFGLLHGFGFAAALQDTGLPQTQVVTALLFFNLGVELGQLFFIAAVLFLVSIVRLLMGKLSVDSTAFDSPSTRVAAYSVGILSSYWFVERMAAFLV